MATSEFRDAGLDRGDRITLFVRSGPLAAWLMTVLLWLAPGLAMADAALHVSNARVPASDQIGINLPLLMTIRNDTAEADALLRVRCPFANFAEKHTVDRGEGAPAMREIKSIPVPQNKTTELSRDGYHVMLLQTRQKLVDGDKFTCDVVFQKAGTKETEVQISERPDRDSGR